jgi:hypothetical protein
MRAHEIITELSYPGNIGIMELSKFFEIATPEQKAHFKQLKAAGKTKEAWKFMQTVTGVKLHEGGWANPVTQGTHITPMLVDRVFKVLHIFVARLNVFLQSKNIPPTELGNPCGSTTYYKRDLMKNPTREYGDIDVNLFIPRIEGTTNNANADTIKKAVQEFCEGDTDFQTSNGTNVIVKVGNDYIQVDLITAFYHNKEWTSALAPEYNVKGVLCNSIYSSLGEALNLSIGGAHGVQGKFDEEGNLVPFKTVKGVTLKTITNKPDSWALDIAKFFGCTKIHPLLNQYPGKLDEVRVSDMINSIKGIALTLQLNSITDSWELLQKIKAIYLGKIEKGIQSSKYDKAATPEAKEKAEHTKEMLAQKSAEFATLFDK